MKVQKISKRHLSKLNYRGQCYFDANLKNLNTFRIDGVAKIYLEVNTIENLIDIVNYLKDRNEKIFVLGGGSNIVVSNYFDGAIIKLGGDFNKINEVDNCIEMGAGVKLSEAYNYTYKCSLGGFEESIGIPGTIGGAVVMNAGCYSFEMAKLVDYVVALNIANGKITYFCHDECKFGYRQSAFDSNYIIIRVGFVLSNCDQKDMEMARKEALSKRLSTQPKGFSAGCVFRKVNNLNVSKMLDDMGIKGKTIGGASVSQKHANFIINNGNASSQDIVELVEAIKIQFKEKYNIDLVTEIKFI